MPEQRVESITPPNRSYPRQELEAMVAKWLQRNVDAEKEGDWPKHYGQVMRGYKFGEFA